MDNNFNALNKKVDGVYKNLLENFHPQTREVVNSAKAYLKALHGSSAACSLYVESLASLSNSIKKQAIRNNENGEVGVGAQELEELTNVLRELHSQQLGYLKAFYVDFIVPIEHNLDRDPKVVQNAWKKYISTSKSRLDTYTKAASTVKRIKKRTKSPNTIYATGNLLDREIKGLSNYQEELTKVQSFFDISLKEVMEMEKRRYGFVRDRQYNLLREQVKLFKQGLHLGQQLIIIDETAEEEEAEEQHQHQPPQNPKLNNQQEIVDKFSSRRIKVPEGKKPERKYIHHSQHQNQAEEPLQLLHTSKAHQNTHQNQMQIQIHEPQIQIEEQKTARAVYEYNNNGKRNSNCNEDDDEDDGFYSSQFLSFAEGDIIRLIGEKSKGGWQYGENIRLHKYGWFPQAYVQLLEEKERPPPPPPAPPLPPSSTPPPTPSVHPHHNKGATLQSNHSSCNEIYATLTRNNNNTNNNKSGKEIVNKKHSIDLPEVDYNEEEDEDVYSVYSIENNFDDDRIRHSRLLFNQFNRFVDKHQELQQPISRSMSFHQHSDSSSVTNNNNNNNNNNLSHYNNVYLNKQLERNKLMSTLSEEKVHAQQPQLFRRLLKRTTSFVSVLNRSKNESNLPLGESEEDLSMLWGSMAIRGRNSGIKLSPSGCSGPQSEDSVFFDDNKAWIKNSVRSSKVNHGPWYDLWGQDISVVNNKRLS